MNPPTEFELVLALLTLQAGSVVAVVDDASPEELAPWIELARDLRALRDAAARLAANRSDELAALLGRVRPGGVE